MIDSGLLLGESVERVGLLVEDLRVRCDGDPELEGLLEGEWRVARDVGRTAVGFGEWREERLTQVAVGWVLSCVFVRFCEDNGLIDVRLSGPGDRLQVARDRYSAFVMERPSEDQRAYLLGVFGELGGLAATARLFGEHNAVWSPVTPSALACKELLEWWWRLDDDGGLVHDFTDPGLDTRFLGDLYQDVSADVRDRYALLQTPEFVESFILDRTLDPAVDEFGLDETDLIDPACGSGHFLLGAFDRLFGLFREREPSGNPVGHAQSALERIAGVDVNPYAVAIARFRLLVAAVRVCGVSRLADVPAFGLRVATGDSLLHGVLPGEQGDLDAHVEDRQHLYATEDPELVTEILSKTYKAVVANPPYITVKDKAANQAYRDRYGSCHRKYSLAVPFFQRMFLLAQQAEVDQAAGFVGQITANSFMKREFGKKLVENYLPHWDLTALIETSGAYLPGHGTPTIIVFGRNRAPVGDTVRAVMGLRGEPSTPADPAKGLVWSAIENQVDEPGTTSDYVQVVEWPRHRLHQHPMIFGGGAELWFRVDAKAEKRLGEVSASMGFHAISGEDAVFLDWPESLSTRLPGVPTRVFVPGTDVRDWAIQSKSLAVFPYDDQLRPILTDSTKRILWPYRTNLIEGLMFGKTRDQRGMEWFEYVNLSTSRDRVPLSIAFAFVSTHNHFVLDRGGKIFNRSAPVIKLPAGSDDADHLRILGVLNSSVGCFWMKQVSHNKGSTVDKRGARQTTIAFENFYEYTGSQLQEFPLVSTETLRLSRELNDLAQEGKGLSQLGSSGGPSQKSLQKMSERLLESRCKRVGFQETLDWMIMAKFGLADSELAGEAPVALELGERAFEIVLARRMAAGEVESSWFERHGSKPITELPSHWPDDYRDLVERRIAAIENDPAGVGFIEAPEFKRRWNWRSWEELQAEALESWLLDVVEGLDIWRSGEVVTVARVAQAARHVEGFVEAAELARGADVDVVGLVGELFGSEAVPHVAGLRLKPSGMRKRAEWERVWELQRAEDDIDARTLLDPSDPDYLTEAEAEKLKEAEVGSIPKPPAYRSADMVGSVWKHRGKLDVPKERFISYPSAEATDGDTTPVFGWAGWDHAEQGRALASLFLERKAMADTEVLVSLLAGVWELVPWVKQWHNEPDSRGRRQGDELERFVQTEARSLGTTTDTLTQWTP